jgi:hypothetical protein
MIMECQNGCLMQRIQEFQRQLSTELRELGALTEEMGSSLSERMHDLEMKEVDIRALQQETAEVPPVPSWFSRRDCTRKAYIITRTYIITRSCTWLPLYHHKEALQGQYLYLK